MACFEGNCEDCICKLCFFGNCECTSKETLRNEIQSSSDQEVLEGYDLLSHALDKNIDLDNGEPLSPELTSCYRFVRNEAKKEAIRRGLIEDNTFKILAIGGIAVGLGMAVFS